jgi:hypothetical protein
MDLLVVHSQLWFAALVEVEEVGEEGKRKVAPFLKRELSMSSSWCEKQAETRFNTRLGFRDDHATESA